MLILVCLGVAKHHATSRMINTIADIDVSEEIESCGEMIRTMRGDIEIMLGFAVCDKNHARRGRYKGQGKR